MTPERSSSDDSRVVPFRRPGAPRWLAPRRGPVPDLKKYEHAESPDDYRHRMTMNLLGFLVTIVLVIAGLCADGVTEVSHVHHIDRGYPDFVGDLRALGVTVERAQAPEEPAFEF